MKNREHYTAFSAPSSSLLHKPFDQKPTALDNDDLYELSPPPSPQLLNEPYLSIAESDLKEVKDLLSESRPLGQVPGRSETVLFPATSLSQSEPDKDTSQEPASLQKSLAVDSIPSLPRHPPHKPMRKKVKICHVLIFLALTTVISSVMPASVLSYSMEDDLQGGVVLRKYIPGAGMLLVGTMAAIHSRTCTCWQR